MTHPVRFGMRLSGQVTTVEGLRTVRRTADESGLDRVDCAQVRVPRDNGG